MFVRIGVTAAEPKGKDWTKIDGSMKNIRFTSSQTDPHSLLFTLSVGASGVCWAVDKGDTVWRRLGAKASNAMGTKWQCVTGRLRQVSVGQAGVWGVSPSNEVGLKGLPVNEEGLRGIPNVEVGLGVSLMLR